MSLPIVLRPEASQDADDAREYLENQRAGLGQRFVNRLKDKLAQICNMPELFGVVWQSVRTARLKRFR